MACNASGNTKCVNVVEVRAPDSASLKQKTRQCFLQHRRSNTKCLYKSHSSPWGPLHAHVVEWVMRHAPCCKLLGGCRSVGVNPRLMSAKRPRPLRCFCRCSRLAKRSPYKAESCPSVAVVHYRWSSIRACLRVDKDCSASWLSAKDG